MISAMMFSSCVTSQEIIISYPENANWNFIYYDASGVNLGDGKAMITVDKEDYTFTISLTESAFGDTAEFKGTIDFTAILDGSVAYSVELEEDVQDILSTLITYREELNTRIAISLRRRSKAPKSLSNRLTKPSTEAFSH